MHEDSCIATFIACPRCKQCEYVQATIQGALGSTPLMLIQARMRNKANYTEYEQWGNEILHATAFSIIISAPIGLLVIALLGPIWLKKVSSVLPILST